MEIKMEDTRTQVFLKLTARFVLNVLCLGWVAQKGLPRNEWLFSESKLTKNFPRQLNNTNNYQKCTYVRKL